MTVLARVAALAVAGSLALAACGSSSAGVAPVGPAASEVAVPETLGGLRVTPETEASSAFADAIKAARASDGGPLPFVTDSVVYSLRAGKELKAVLQISRLTGDAEPESREFRRAIAAQIGRGDVESPDEMGDVLVYTREGNQQTIHLWFVDHIMMILFVRTQETVQGSGLGFDPAQVLAETIAIEPPPVAGVAE